MTAALRLRFRVTSHTECGSQVGVILTAAERPFPTERTPRGDIHLMLRAEAAAALPVNTELIVDFSLVHPPVLDWPPLTG